MRILSVLLLLFGYVYAESLEDIFKIAEKNSPFLKANLFQSKVYEGNIIQADSYYNPQVQIEFGRLVSQTDSGFALTNLQIFQQLRLWGDKDLAIKSAKLQKEAQQYFFQDKKNVLFSQIYNAFYNVLYQKELLLIRKRQLKISQGIYGYIQKGYNLGEFTELDLLRAKQNLELTKSRYENQKAKFKASIISISSLIGKNISSVDGNFYKLYAIDKIAIENLPIFKYYQLLIKAIDTQIKRQKALAKPQIYVGLVVGEDPVDLGKYEAGVAFNFTVPVFYKNQGQIVSLTYRKKSILEKQRQINLQFENNLKAIISQLDIIKTQIEKVENEIIPKAENSLVLADKSFKNRVITFFEYSNIQNQYFNTLMYRASLYYSYNQLIANYIRIGGTMYLKNYEGGLK